MKLRMKCRDCGSTSVLRDAYAEWNEESQEWELQNIFDAAICCSEECDGGETEIEEEEITIEKDHLP